MNDPMPQQCGTLAELQDLLLDLVGWSQGHSQYGLYCKLCGAEGIEVEHDSNCPVPDVRPAVNAVRPDMALLRTLVAAFVAWGKPIAQKGRPANCARLQPRGTNSHVRFAKRPSSRLENGLSTSQLWDQGRAMQPR
jgi:hypothetical protein